MTQVPALVDLTLHDETHRARARHLNHRPVDPTGVVAEHQDPALGRHVLQPDHREPVAGRHDARDQEAHQGLGQLPDGIDGPDQGDDRQGEHEHPAAQVGEGGGDGQPQEAQHPDVLDEVVGGQHPAEPLLARVELDQGIERHQEHPAQEPQGEEVEGMHPGRVEAGQEEQGGGDAQGTDGDQGGLDVAPGEPARGHRAQDDPDPGAGQHALDDHGIGLAQGLLGVGREHRQHHLGDGPEHREPDDGEPDHPVVPGGTQVLAQIATAAIGAPVESQGHAGTHRRQPVGQEELHQGAGHQHPAHGRHQVHDRPGPVPGRAGQPTLEQDGEDEDPGQDGRGGGRLHPAVCRGKLLLAHQLLDVAVLGRRIEGALHRQQEGHGEGGPEPAEMIEEGDRQGDGHRRPGARAHHGDLGEAVGQGSRRG